MAENNILSMISKLLGKKKEEREAKESIPSDYGLENYIRRIDAGEVGEQIVPVDMSPMKRKYEKDAAFWALREKHPDFVLKKPTHPDRLMKRDILKELRTATQMYDADRIKEADMNLHPGARSHSELYGKYGAHPTAKHKKIARDLLQRSKGVTAEGEAMYEPFEDLPIEKTWPPRIKESRIPMQSLAGVKQTHQPYTGKDEHYNPKWGSELTRDWFRPYSSGPDELAKRGYNMEANTPSSDFNPPLSTYWPSNEYGSDVPPMGTLGAGADKYHYRRRDHQKKLDEYENKMQAYRQKRAKMMEDYDAQMDLLELKHEED
mgnify:CR=1 FL=1